VTLLRALQAGNEWRYGIPQRVAGLIGLLAVARSRDAVLDESLSEGLTVVEQALRSLAWTAYEGETAGDLLAWAEWARRVFRMTDFTVSSCTASRVGSAEALANLTAVALELDWMGTEARQVATFLGQSVPRGAA
jgi:hypothetical protein